MENDIYFHRGIEKTIRKAAKGFPSLLVTGARQVGKSTLLRKVFNRYEFVTLDDPFNRELANFDPEAFLAHHGRPLIIDEIQYAPKLFPYLKMEIDQNRKDYGRFILTGSQIFPLMKGVMESLAGRIAIFDLYPLSVSEIPGFSFYDQERLNETILRGLFPELQTNPAAETEIWFNTYVTTYLEKDVRAIKAVSDLNLFQKFIRLLAARAGSLLNLSEVAKECGITQPTAKAWLSILQATYIIYLLKPYHNNHSKRVVKSPKLYFLDTGLLANLLGVSTTKSLIRSAMIGHIFENFVIMEVLKLFSFSGKRDCLYFYRSASGLEVDLLIETEGELNAYEIKFAKTLHPKDGLNLEKFQREHSVCSCTLLSLKKESVPLSRNVCAKHWSSL